MAKAFFYQNETTAVWEYGEFQSDGETIKAEGTLPAGLYRRRWITKDGIACLSILNANNIGYINPFNELPVTDIDKDLSGTAYTDRAEFDTATKDFFFRVGGILSIDGITFTDQETGLKGRATFKGGQWYFDKELTATGFAGTESLDGGATGDWMTSGGF